MVRASHPRLRGLVVSYHGYRMTDLPPGVHRGLPSTALTVVIAFDEPLDVGWLGDDGSRGRHWAMASGLHVGPALIRHHGFQHGVQLGLTPAGSRALLGIPAAALAGELVGLDELLGTRSVELYDGLANAASWAARFDVLDRFLSSRLGDGLSDVRPELTHVWRRLERRGGRVRVDDLAGELGWSRRHLAGQFRREFGVTPKELARVVRFQRARSLLPGKRLAQVAAEAGFADQSHLAREWRELAGCSPSRWLREEFPFVQDGSELVEAG
jgi:AraC-like DNA-binding protein